MKKWLLTAGLLVFVVLFVWVYGKHNAQIRLWDDSRHYVGTYGTMEKEDSTSFSSLFVIRNDFTGNNITLDRLPLGPFDWHFVSDEDGHDRIVCTWSSSSHTLMLSGIGKFKEFEYGLLLTPTIDPNSGSPIMHQIAVKLSSEVLDTNNPQMLRINN